MDVRVLVTNAMVLSAMACMFAVGTERNAHVLVRGATGSQADVSALEQRAAQSRDPASVAALAGAYLDQQQPGLATAVIDRASPEVRNRPEVAQVHARALFGRGRVRDALATAQQVQDSCAGASSGESECPPWLVAKAARQVEFMEALVLAGIEDPARDPQATRAAYDRSAREVRLVAMR